MKGKLESCTFHRERNELGSFDEPVCRKNVRVVIGHLSTDRVPCKARERLCCAMQHARAHRAYMCPYWGSGYRAPRRLGTGYESRGRRQTPSPRSSAGFGDARQTSIEVQNQDQNRPNFDQTPPDQSYNSILLTSFSSQHCEAAEGASMPCVAEMLADLERGPDSGDCQTSVRADILCSFCLVQWRTKQLVFSFRQRMRKCAYVQVCSSHRGFRKYLLVTVGTIALLVCMLHFHSDSKREFSAHDTQVSPVSLLEYGFHPSPAYPGVFKSCLHKCTLHNPCAGALLGLSASESQTTRIHNQAPPNRLR